MFEEHKNIFQHTGKFDDRQNLKDILDFAMMSTPEEIIDDNTIFPMTKTTVKKVLVNHCVYSPTYLMLKRKQKNIVLELQNKNA